MMLYVALGKRAGFTLIEIMIVIAIIAILAGIVVPNIAMARFEAGITACQENCKIGLQAVQMARVRHTLQEIVAMLDGGVYSNNSLFEEYFGDLGSEFVEAGYLGKPLRCTVTGYLYWYWYYREKKPVDSCVYGWYRDWMHTQPLKDGGSLNCVICYYDCHRYGDCAVVPTYDEGLGACFYW